jgi:hypothetical protein
MHGFIRRLFPLQSSRWNQQRNTLARSTLGTLNLRSEGGKGKRWTNGQQERTEKHCNPKGCLNQAHDIQIVIKDSVLIKFLWRSIFGYRYGTKA